MSKQVNSLPRRNTPFFQKNPSMRGIPQDASNSVIENSWYLFFQDLVTSLLAGTAGGDLSGTYPNPTVAGLQGNPIDPTAPSTSDVLAWNGTVWIPTAPSVTPGAATIDYHTISGAFNIVASVLPAPANGLLIVALTMAGGAVQPTWDAASFTIAPSSVSILVGTKTNVLFCANGSGKWMQVAPPMTGR